MGFSFKSIGSNLTNDFKTVGTAGKISEYNQQYLRRLLREGIFQSKRLGQLWLIDRDSFINYLNSAKRSKDKRFGPISSTFLH